MSLYDGRFKIILSNNFVERNFYFLIYNNTKIKVYMNFVYHDRYRQTKYRHFTHTLQFVFHVTLLKDVFNNL